MIELVDFKENFESNTTACLGCEQILLFSDLWDMEYCCRGCRNDN